MVITLVHIQGAPGFALFVAGFTKEHFPFVLVDISDVHIEGISPRVMSSTVGAREVCVTYKGEHDCLQLKTDLVCDRFAYVLAMHQDF